MLKRKLGLTAWREFSEDIKEGMKKLRGSPMYQKVEETLRETLNELKHIIISSDEFMIKTVEKVEDGVEKAMTKASEELQKAVKKTADGFLDTHIKDCQSLQKPGDIDHPKQCCKEAIPSVMEKS